MQMVHLTMLHNGRILAIDQHVWVNAAQAAFWPDVILIDPFASPPTFQLIREGLLPDVPGGDMDGRHWAFCSGHTTLSDGRVYVAGGDPYCCRLGIPASFPNPYFSSVYTPSLSGGPGTFTAAITECWDHADTSWDGNDGTCSPAVGPDPWSACDPPSRSVSRYYPTVVERGNGELVVLDGACICKICECSEAPCDPNPGCARCDPRWGNGNVPLRVFPSTTDPWTWKSEPIKTAEYNKRSGDNYFAIGFYPHVFQVASGDLFYAGGSSAAWECSNPPCPDPFLVPCTSGCTIRSRKLSPAGTWSELPNGAVALQGGAAAIYYRRDPAQPEFTLREEVVKAGRAQEIESGVECPNRDAYRISLSDASPSWAAIGPMPTWRNHFYIITCPDGRLYAIGQRFIDIGPGTCTPGDRAYQVSGSIVDIYDPQANQWCYDATNMTTGRFRYGYHSAALLTPRASIFIGGQPRQPYTDCCAQYQIYEPAYLQASGRPQILGGSLPENSEIYYGSSFEIDYAGSQAITAARLIRPGSATHAMDVTQRMVDLDWRFVPSTGKLRITPPSNPNMAPPGWYMLFICSGTHPSGLAGSTPSDGVFLRLRNPPLP